MYIMRSFARKQSERRKSKKKKHTLGIEGRGKVKGKARKGGKEDRRTCLSTNGK